MKSHSVEYKIIGDFSQILEINLEPQKTIITDAAFLLYFDEEIQLQQRDTDGADEVEEEEVEELNEELLEEETNTDEEAPFGELDDPFSPSPSPSFLSEEEPENMEGLDDSIMGDLEEEEFNDDFESEEEIDPSKGNLLGKLWTATRKRVQSIKVGRGGEDKEEDDDDTIDEEGMGLPEGFDPESIGGNMEDDPIDMGDFPGMPEELEEPEEESPPPKIFTHLSNESDFIRTVALAPAQSCHVLDINLGQLEGNVLHICKGSFVAAAKGTEITTFAETDILLRPQDEEGLVIERLAGDGMAFIKAKGDVVERILEDDAIRVNLASVVAFEPSIELDLDSIQSLVSLQEENPVILAIFSGSGMLWLQSNQMPPQIIQNILPKEEAPTSNSSFEEPAPPPMFDNDPELSPELDLPEMNGGELPMDFDNEELPMSNELTGDEEGGGLSEEDDQKAGGQGDLDEHSDLIPPEIRALTEDDDE